MLKIMRLNNTYTNPPESHVAKIKQVICEGRTSNEGIICYGLKVNDTKYKNVIELEECKD